MSGAKEDRLWPTAVLAVLALAVVAMLFATIAEAVRSETPVQRGMAACRASGGVPVRALDGEALFECVRRGP